MSECSPRLAFYSFLAFVPLLGATVLTYGLFADPADVGEHLRTLIISCRRIP